MTITIAGTAFHYHDYDARGDTLFLGIGGPREVLAARAYETPEGHIVEYDEAGSLIALEWSTSAGRSSGMARSS